MMHKQASGLMRRSSRSFNLTSPSVSDSSISSCTTLESEARLPSAACFPSPKGSFSCMKETSFTKNTWGSDLCQTRSFQSMSLKTNTCAGQQMQSVASLRSDTSDPTVVVQYFLFLALAFQLPHMFTEIAELLELHYHSFPLLVVLSVFPSMLKKGRTGVSPGSVSFLSDQSSRDCLASIQEYYKNNKDNGELLSPARLSRVETISNDEWGHFADFDESFANEEMFIIKSSISGFNLCTLEETEEEE